MNWTRTPLTLKIRIFQVLFIALFFCMLYFDLGPIEGDNNDSIQNRLGAMFFISLNFFILYFQVSISTFPVEKDIFIKEYDSGLYSITPYYLSKLSIEVPLTAIFPFFFLLIVYWIVGFAPGFDKFISFAIIAIAECWVGMLMGILVGTFVKNLQVAIEVAPMVFIPFVLFSGFTTNTDSIIPPLKIFEYSSPMRYTFEYFVRNEFEDHDELGESNPIETLNFSFSMTFILIFMYSYIVLLTVLSLLSLKYNSKGIKN